MPGKTISKDFKKWCNPRKKFIRASPFYVIGFFKEIPLPSILYKQFQHLMSFLQKLSIIII